MPRRHSNAWASSGVVCDEARIVRARPQAGAEGCSVDSRERRRARGFGIASAAILAMGVVTGVVHRSETARAIVPAAPISAALVSPGSLGTVAKLTGAADMWACGWTGAGVDV